MSPLQNLVVDKRHYTNAIDTVHSFATQRPYQFKTRMKKWLLWVQLVQMEPVKDVTLLGTLIENKNGNRFISDMLKHFLKNTFESCIVFCSKK